MNHTAILSPFLFSGAMEFIAFNESSHTRGRRWTIGWTLEAFAARDAGMARVSAMARTGRSVRREMGRAELSGGRDTRGI